MLVGIYATFWRSEVYMETSLDRNYRPWYIREYSITLCVGMAPKQIKMASLCRDG